MIRRLDENDPINISVGDAIKALWTDPGRMLYFYYYLILNSLNNFFFVFLMSFEFFL